MGTTEVEADGGRALSYFVQSSEQQHSEWWRVATNDPPIACAIHTRRHGGCKATSGCLGFGYAGTRVMLNRGQGQLSTCVKQLAALQYPQPGQPGTANHRAPLVCAYARAPAPSLKSAGFEDFC